jgi:nucleotide-binding universal stress UspA family protein
MVRGDRRGPGDDGATAGPARGARVKELAIEHIVVGVDGSAASERALSWALDQARARGATVEAIHAWTVPDMGADPLAQALADPGELAGEARREVDLVVEHVCDGQAAVPVEVTVVCGDPSRCLVAAGRRADLIVVGRRGLGGEAADGLGSVTDRVVRQAPCPVVVVPGPHA